MRFAVLRDQFTPVHWFYDRDRPSALQHGIRLIVLGTGSIGYFSWGALLTKTLLCATAFSLAQQLLDFAWYYLYPQSRLIAAKAYHPLDIREARVSSTSVSHGPRRGRTARSAKTAP